MTNIIDYNDGEIHAWSGGECPVHPDSAVDFSRGGHWVRGGRAGDTDWSQPLLFRVTEQHIEPAAPAAPPKPLELWVNVHENGWSTVSRSYSEAESWQAAFGGRTVHMREVTE